MKNLCKQDLCKQGIGMLLALLSFNACNNSGNNYPSEYVGFEKRTETYTLRKEAKEQDISVKIIAAEKRSVDREVTLVGKWKPGEEPMFRLLDTNVIIPAKKKSALAHVRFFPMQMKRNTEIRMICTPQDKEAKQSQLTLKLATE